MAKAKGQKRIRKPVASSEKNLKALIGVIARNPEAHGYYLSLIAKGKAEQQAAVETLNYIKRKYGEGIGRW